MSTTKTKKYRIKKKCPHNKSYGSICQYCSRYKLVFLLKNSHRELRVHFPATGKKVNPSLHSFIQENKYSANQVLARMLKRIKENEEYNILYQGSNVIRLYDTQTDQFLSHKP